MAATLKIDKMSIPDKLQAMELLWSSLRQNEQELPSPEWHRELLEKRLASKSAFVDWSEAKQRIRSKLK